MNLSSFHLVCILWMSLCLAGFACSAQVQHYNEADQIAALLKEKGSRTAVQRKISSRLLQAMKEYAGSKEAKAAGLEPAEVGLDRSGNLLVDISATVTDQLLGTIKVVGGKVVYPSKQYRTVRAQIPIAAAEKLAALNEVTFIKPASRPATGTP